MIHPGGPGRQGCFFSDLRDSAGSPRPPGKPAPDRHERRLLDFRFSFGFVRNWPVDGERM